MSFDCKIFGHGTFFIFVATCFKISLFIGLYFNFSGVLLFVKHFLPMKVIIGR